MKNYLIAFLLVIIVFSGSLHFKNRHQLALVKFPVSVNNKNDLSHPKIYLYFFFTKSNCSDCLQIIETLNELPEHFKVTGVIPKSEVDNELDIRKITGVIFDLKPFDSKFKFFTPNYSPTLFGVGQKGCIYFVLPGVQNEKDYLNKFLIDFYSKAFPLLLNDKKF